MKKSRLSIVKLCVIVPIALLLIAFVWVLARAHLELGGSQPNQQILGRALTDGQRAMDQACTGVVTTKQSVWLVGRIETEDGQNPPQGAINLDSLLPAGSTPDTDSHEVSEISRLGSDGAFHTVAYINGEACALPSADKASMLLLTGAQPPEKKAGLQTQTAVFQADDQGKNWRVLQGGFMADAGWLAWGLNPYFHGSNEVWAAGQGKLFYSSDQGAHAQAIESTDQLWQAPQGTLSYTPGDPVDIAAHVIQFNDQQATAWVSQSYWDTDRKRQTFTRETQLTLHDGHWEAGAIRTTQGLYLDEVKDDGAGHVIAELSRSIHAEDELAELGQDGHSWSKLGDLPNPFWPLPASSSIRSNQQTNFYVSGPLILATITSEYETVQPSFLGSKRAKIEGNGVFFSNDKGNHWKKLAIPGYLGVLGFNAEKKQVYWDKGNWFHNPDRNIYSSDLSQ
ncbi:hypothetical protein [Paraburkholderia sp. ZP32-5]|uniref:hypothetical protein n=1 Tax=Paraburkholderia sp. ZP32-5 TaxID=2883245 RepID=UPI001F205535|nr:hypothetical protein [Paraburkholderia sp. ZP32-5]